jgi:hypothetical protein
MTIEQTVEIPADRRLHLDFEFPLEIPVGKARVTVTPVVETPKKYTSLLSMRGSCEGIDTMEAYFERKRVEKEQEDRKDRQRTGNNL